MATLWFCHQTMAEVSGGVLALRYECQDLAVRQEVSHVCLASGSRMGTQVKGESSTPVPVTHQAVCMAS